MKFFHITLINSTEQIYNSFTKVFFIYLNKNKTIYMSSLKQRISTPLIFVWYAAKIISIGILISFSFWLLNQPDDIALYSGILLFILIISYVINSIFTYIKNKTN